ncbi:hypothetical protein GCM10029964_080380 [Kibdelosporangium lantanae]
MSKQSDNTIDVFASEPGQIRRVEIDIVGGNIRINATKGNTVKVRAKGDVKTLGAKASVHRDVLRIGSSSALRYFIQKSRIDLILDVPEETAIDIKVFGADIVINGGTGPLKVKGFAGAIEGTTYSDNVSIKFRVGGNDLVQKAKR